MALLLALHGGQFGAHQMKIVQRAAHMLQQALARGVQADAGGHAIEQLGAQLVFQTQDLPVHRAGGDEQVLRRFADRSAARDLEKVFQDNRVHRAPRALF